MPSRRCPCLASSRRRPSAAILIALLALFVALGGPARLRKLCSAGKDIKNRSLTTKDLSKKAVKALEVDAARLGQGAPAGQRRGLERQAATTRP